MLLVVFDVNTEHQFHVFNYTIYYISLFCQFCLSCNHHITKSFHGKSTSPCFVLAIAWLSVRLHWTGNNLLFVWHCQCHGEVALLWHIISCDFGSCLRPSWQQVSVSKDLIIRRNVVCLFLWLCYRSSKNVRAISSLGLFHCRWAVLLRNK